MAKYTVEKSEFGVYSKTLSPNEIDEIVFVNPSWSIEIFTDGEESIYLTTNGEDPVVGDGKCRELPNFASVRTINISRGFKELTIKLISAGSPTYSVFKS